MYNIAIDRRTNNVIINYKNYLGGIFMRYTVYNKAMKRPVFQTNDLEEAIDYTRRHPRKSRRHCIYDDKLKTFDIKKIRLAAGI